MKIGIRTWILIISLLLAVLMISPSFEKGVVVKGVDRESSAYLEGITEGMIITEINGIKIDNFQRYGEVVHELFDNGSKRIEIKTKKETFIFLTDSLNISVEEIPKTKVKTGLDLSGGSRALVKAENVSLSGDELNDLVTVTNQRLNAFGITDVGVRAVSDLSGESYMSIEIAGQSPQRLRELIGQQGKFEAKVGNTSVFIGGERDISDVCRNRAECSGIRACSAVQGGGYACNFDFVIYLTEAAAQRHAEVTKSLSLDSTGRYLNESLYLYVDDIEMDSLLIGADLRGQVTTQIMISGSGTGNNEQEAFESAQKNMKNLQTILITGSLPYKLEIVKLDTISPTLGKEFSKSLMFLGIGVFIAVSLSIFIRYRNIKSTLAVILTMASEVFITVGIAALIKWNLDAPAIAGIIAGIGTGVNDQIVLLDEAEKGGSANIKERIKNALFIIFGAFFTIVAAMLPLFWAGAGMLRGFAFTTILGVSVGILITRPAFAEMIRKIKGE